MSAFIILMALVGISVTFGVIQYYTEVALEYLNENRKRKQLALCESTFDPEGELRRIK